MLQICECVGGGGRSETEGVAEREERRARREEGVMDGVTAAGDTLSLPPHLLREGGTLVKSALGERAKGPGGAGAATATGAASATTAATRQSVAKGPSAAHRAGTHSGAEPPQFEAHQVDGAAAVRILDDTSVSRFTHFTSRHILSCTVASLFFHK